MKKILTFTLFFFVVYNVSSQSFKREIRGEVTNENNTLKNVSVRIENTSIGVLTDAEGRYSIQAMESDVLIFSYVGLQTIKVELDSENNVVDIKMSIDVQKLDEVVVKKRRPFTQKELLAEYPTNKDLIKTSWGILDKKRASFSIRVIDGKDLIPIGSDFLYSLQNLYPQMVVIRDGDFFNPKVYLQRWSTGARPQAIFDVDGFLHEKAPAFLSANDIDRVAILLRSGAISRYGPAGAGGVIIINTKSKTWMDDIAVKRYYDNSDLIDSVSQIVNTTKIYSPSVSEYLLELNRSKSEMEAQRFLRGNIF